MIDTKYLTDFIQNELNNNTLGKLFAIYADEGDLKKSVGKGEYKKQWTSGVLQIVSDSFVNLTGLEFQTINTSLMLFVDLQANGWTDETDTTRKQSINLLDVKKVIDDTISRLNGQPQKATLGNKTYTITANINRPTNGDKMALGEINDGIPLYLSLGFTIFEDGVNSNDMKFYIDGVEVPCMQNVITAQTQVDQTEFAGIIGNACYPLTKSKSFDIVIPLTEETWFLYDDIMSDVLNKVYLLSYNKRGGSLADAKLYNCFLVKGQITMEAGMNVGLNLSFSEAYVPVGEVE